MYVRIQQEHFHFYSKYFKHYYERNATCISFCCQNIVQPIHQMLISFSGIFCYRRRPNTLDIRINFQRQTHPSPLFHNNCYLRSYMYVCVYVYVQTLGSESMKIVQILTNCFNFMCLCVCQGLLNWTFQLIFCKILVVCGTFM